MSISPNEAKQLLAFLEAQAAEYGSSHAVRTQSFAARVMNDGRGFSYEFLGMNPSPVSRGTLLATIECLVDHAYFELFKHNHLNTAN